MQKLSIIGSSRIVEEHIKVAQKAGFEIINIYSSRKNSKNAINLSNKYKIKNQKNYKLFLDEVQKGHSNVLIAGRISKNAKYLNDIIKFNRPIFIEKPVFTNFKHFEKYKKYQDKIFVGYNRIYYQNINVLKKLIKKKKKP
jgi:predicted dehydrogenase